MSDGHIDDLLAAYALGSLEDEELAAVAGHLAHCQRCQQELHAYQEVVDQMALAAPLSEPPADLKRKILAGVERQAVPAETPQEKPRKWRLPTFFHVMTPTWGLVSLILIVALGAVNLYLWKQLQAMGEPDSLEIISLVGTEANAQAEGLVILERRGHDGTLVVNDLPPLDEGSQYQFWFLEGEKRTDGGVFSVSATGYGWLYIELPKPLSAYTGFGVTIEPAGGSPQPTGQKVLGVDF